MRAALSRESIEQGARKTGFKGLVGNTHVKAIDKTIQAQEKFVSDREVHGTKEPANDGRPNVQGNRATMQVPTLNRQSLGKLNTLLEESLKLASHHKTSPEDKARVVLWCMEAAAPYTGQVEDNPAFQALADLASSIYFERATGLTITARQVDYGHEEPTGWETGAGLEMRWVSKMRDKYQFEQIPGAGPSNNPVDWLRAQHWHGFKPGNQKLIQQLHASQHWAKLPDPSPKIDPASLSAHELQELREGYCPWKIKPTDPLLPQLYGQVQQAVAQALRDGGLRSWTPGQEFVAQLPDPHRVRPANFSLGVEAADFLKGDNMPV